MTKFLGLILSVILSASAFGAGATNYNCDSNDINVQAAMTVSMFGDSITVQNLLDPTMVDELGDRLVVSSKDFCNVSDTVELNKSKKYSHQITFAEMLAFGPDGCFSEANSYTKVNFLRDSQGADTAFELNGLKFKCRRTDGNRDYFLRFSPSDI